MKKTILIVLVALTTMSVNLLAQDKDMVTTAKVSFVAGPKGAVNGKAVFSVAADKQVYFSKGNLQYNTETQVWRFAENQYDYLAYNQTGYNPSTVEGWIDVFAYGHSGSKTGGEPNVYSSVTSSAIANTNYDWGVYCPIQNGGKLSGQWRTLTTDEWKYLLNVGSPSASRTKANKLQTKISIDGINGLVIMPDGYDYTNKTPDATLTAEQWKTYEADGCVFLPFAGRWVPSNSAYESSTTEGFYWCSSAVQSVIYHSSTATPGITGTVNHKAENGTSVRLVQDK